MEETKRSGGKKGGVNLGGLGGGGGGVVVVVGGALVAAAVWSICELRRRKKPSCKKGTLKDFQTPNLENVKNVDEGKDGLCSILQNPKLSADIHESETEENDASSLGLLLDVEKSSKLGTIDEEIQEGNEIEEDGLINESELSIQKEDSATCEATKQEAVEFCDDSMDADALSSDSADESGSGSLVEDNQLIEDIAVKLDEDFEVSDEGIMLEEKREVIQSASPVCILVDGSNDAVSEDLEYKGSEESSRGTCDSSTDSNTEAVWPEESLKALSQAIEQDKNLNVIPNEIIDVHNNETPSSPNTGIRSIVNGIHHKETYDDNNVSVCKEGLGSGSAMKFQMVSNSKTVRIWVSTVLVAMLVLLAALLVQQKYLSPALADSLSSTSDLPMK
ncbi:unnamed protein product [Rhodiola kirilowii]